MFDEETRSLWSTFEGKPVIGRLAGSDLELRSQAVVTTTWGEWRREHPDTVVLSLDTGYGRDYSEGAAYREYFGTDRLMFGVPTIDRRLRNKAEVLVMRVTPSSGEPRRVPVAISVELLKKQRVFHADVGRPLVVVTSRNGANRVYDAGAFGFKPGTSDDRLVDQSGRIWRVTENALEPETSGLEKRPRVAAQRAFWFGWQAQFPETLLIK